MTRRQSLSAFTLIEVLVVVVVLGVLAGMVIAQFMNVTVDTQQAAFMANGRHFVDAITRFEFENGFFPDAAPDTLPPGLEEYLSGQYFVGGTPIGGVWNTSVNAWGVTAAVGVFFQGGPATARSDEYMQQIDAKIDDGDLATGIFRKGSDVHYFFVIEE